MWLVLVVMDDILDKDLLEMPTAQNKHSIEALAPEVPTERSAKALALGARTGVRMVLMPSDLKTASKLEVNLASRSKIRNLTGWVRSVSSMLRFRACCGSTGVGQGLDASGAGSRVGRRTCLGVDG